MVEQLDWQVPEHIIVPGGNLANSAALGKGFSEMLQPRPHPAHPEDQRHPGLRCEPTLSLVHRLQPRHEAGPPPIPAPPRSASGNPAKLAQVAAVIEQMGGWCEQVSEAEIALAKAEIGAEGVGCETGLRRYAGRPQESWSPRAGYSARSAPS